MVLSIPTVYGPPPRRTNERTVIRTRLWDTPSRKACFLWKAACSLPLGVRLFYEKPLTAAPSPYIITLLWRCNSVGQSSRFIPDLSLVRIQSPLPKKQGIRMDALFFALSAVVGFECPRERIGPRWSLRTMPCLNASGVRFRIQWQPSLQATGSDPKLDTISPKIGGGAHKARFAPAAGFDRSLTAPAAASRRYHRSEP